LVAAFFAVFFAAFLAGAASLDWGRESLMRFILGKCF
jgi:hypothetical protein